jgi:hypothetical protein
VLKLSHSARFTLAVLARDRAGNTSPAFYFYH